MLADAQIRGTETFFVMSNNAGKNQVIEFVLTSDGTVVAKETFDTHGRGTGGVNDPLEALGSLTTRSCLPRTREAAISLSFRLLRDD